MRRGIRSNLPGLALVAIVALLLTGWTGPQPLRSAVLAQDVTSLGLPRLGETAWELVGRSERAASDIELAGFLGFVAGAEPDLLFPDPNRPAEETARFTFSAQLAVEHSSGFDVVRTTTASGVLTIFFRADARADPAPVATFDLQMREILTARDGSSPLAAGSARLAQTAAEPFAHDGTTYRLGREGARLELLLAGVATTVGSGSDDATVTFAGHAELTGAAGPSLPAPPTPTVDEEPAVETPTPVVAGGDPCAAIVPWVETTSAQVADIELLVEFVLEIERTSELTADQFRAAADTLDVLAEQQRAADLPVEAEDARDAVASAVDAIAEAVRALAAAAEAADEDDFDAAQAELAAAFADLGDALAVAEAVAAPCGEAVRR